VIRLRSSPLPALAVGAALLAACSNGSGSDNPGSEPTITETSAPPDGTRECVSPAGYRVEYPASWFTSSLTDRFPCRYFHPEPFTLPPDTEATGIAIRVQMAPAPIERVAPPPGGSRAVEILSRRETKVAERRALRVETRATGQALLPAGLRSMSYYVDFGSRTLTATTSEAAGAGRFADNLEILDRMMGSVSAAGRSSTCSADTGFSKPSPQAGLPPAVAATRASIVEAAAQCNYQELARLARSGESPFTYSFGGGDDPAGYWQRLASNGEPVLSILAELLDRPFASRTVGQATQYVWPSAYSYERWGDVPEPEREALRPIYGDEDFRRFEQFGSYAGYRVGITAGEWIFFVGGD
jgi:hypothetical protein